METIAETSPGKPGAYRPDAVTARLDALPLTRLHWLILLIAALGLAFDVIEAALGNALAAIFSGPGRQIAPYQLSLLLASIFAGGAIGAPLFGRLADRHGRCVALSGCLLLLAGSSAAAAASADITQLTIFRTLSGLAIGAYPPLMVAYLSDVLPPKRRGAMIMLVGAIGFLGAPAVILLIRWLTPLQPLGFEGWRWALMIGAIGAAAIGAAFRFLPESPRWLAAAGREREAAASCDLFERSARSFAATEAEASAPAPTRGAAGDRGSAAQPHYRARVIVLCALYFFSPWATIGFPLLSGAVLIQKGFAVADSLMLVGLSLFGPSIGVLASLAFVDRLDRRTVLALSAGGMALSGAAFAAAEAPALLVAAGLAFNLIGSIYVGALSIYGAELFPTAKRGTLSASAWSVNRVASALAPLALLPLLNLGGASAMIAAIVGALGASIAVILLFGERGLSRSSLS